MGHRAKFFARVFDYAAEPTMEAGSMRFTVEWKRLDGARQGGKAIFVIDDISTDRQLKDDLRDKLAEHLSSRFAPEVVRPRDIVGYSV